jgi:TadE-like protein
VVIRARRRRQRGQALVEFALVAPPLILVLLLILDFGRGLLYYSEMAVGAREASRQAVLKYNNRSNELQPSCSPCQVPGVMPLLNRIAGVGYPAPVYRNSGSATEAPWYGRYADPAHDGSPGTITLSDSAASNTPYIFVYEFDPATDGTTWATCPNPPQAPAACDGVRSGGRLVVVEIKMRWQPAILTYAGLGPSLTLDSRTVSREEW